MQWRAYFRGVRSLKFYPVLGLACLCPEGLSETNVSEIPELPYYSGMQAIVGVMATDALVVSFEENGPFVHLAYDGWSWVEVERHATTDWLGIPRLTAGQIHPFGDEVLVFDASRLINGVNIPEVSILRREDGRYVYHGKVTMEPFLTHAAIFSVSIEDVLAMKDLLLVRLSTALMGGASEQWLYSVVRTAEGWQLGPRLQLNNGYTWPLFSECTGGLQRLYLLQMVGVYDGQPKPFVMTEYLLEDNNWRSVRQLAEFETAPQWVGTSFVRTLRSSDGQSLLLFNSETELNPIRPVELVREGENWTFRGPLSLNSPTGLDLYLVKSADGVALLRAGEAVAPMYDAPLQHYHLLEHRDGVWTLCGDLPSHRLLTDYWSMGLSYAIYGDRLTVFDYSRWNEAARTYVLPEFEPVLINWFPDSVATLDGWEFLPAFGYFYSAFTTDRSLIWIWHASLGWICVYGRDSSGFWLWQSAFGWMYLNSEWFDLSAGRAWLYVAFLGDYLWYAAPTINPRFFFSSHYAEWITDQPAPEGDAASAAEWAHQIAEELGKDETIQFTLDMEYSLAIFSTSGMVDGKRVSVTIEAPWLYLPVVDYPSHSRFTLDLSWLTLSVDDETVTVHSSQFWTDAEVLLPTLFTVDFFFYSSQSGVWLERVDFNDGTSSLSDRVTFGL